LFRSGVERIITDIFTDPGVVFLFDETVVILVIGSAAGKLDGVTFTPIPQPFVDKLSVIVAIEAKKGKWEVLEEGNQALEAPCSGFIRRGPIWFNTLRLAAAVNRPNLNEQPE
jgi:hypothetical protein